MNHRCLAALALVAACSGRDAPPSSTTPSPAHNDYAQAHVLRTYQVAPGQERRAERLLREIRYPVQVVSEQGTQTQFVRANVTTTGDGIFVMSAPIGIHEGVTALLEKLAAAPAEQAPAMIETTYWIVLGYPAPETTIDPGVGEAKTALAELKQLGPMRFELLDRVQLAALDGEEASAAGHAVRGIRETASHDGDRIALRLKIDLGMGKAPTSIETAVTVRPDQFAVLGQAGYVPDAPAPGTAPARASLFYIVRARRL